MCTSTPVEGGNNGLFPRVIPGVTPSWRGRNCPVHYRHSFYSLHTLVKLLGPWKQKASKHRPGYLLALLQQYFLFWLVATHQDMQRLTAFTILRYRSRVGLRIYRVQSRNIWQGPHPLQVSASSGPPETLASDMPHIHSVLFKTQTRILICVTHGKCNQGWNLWRKRNAKP